MSKLMNSTAYEVKPDNLILDSKHPVDVTVVVLASGQGNIARGTVLSITSDGKYVVTGSELDDGITATANCVVSEDIDTGSTTGSDIATEVYVAGHLNQNEFTVAKDYTLTSTDKEELRKAGIFVGSANTI